MEGELFGETIGARVRIGITELRAAPRESGSKWHPKITPYRLIVLLTPIALGSAKLASAYQGKARASTTLEWVLGVVVFLFLHFLSAYESLVHTRPPLGLGWLFGLDCLDGFWHITDLLNLPRPQYRSDEIPTINDRGTHPAGRRIPVTTYRLVVSLTVFILGMTKAVLGYFGSQKHGSALLDWVLGVGATSILYYVGLFENNSVGLGHSFFRTDRYQEILAACNPGRKIAVYALSMYISLIWSTFCATCLASPWGGTGTAAPRWLIVGKTIVVLPTTGFGTLPLMVSLFLVVKSVSPDRDMRMWVPVSFIGVGIFLVWGLGMVAMLRLNPKLSDFEPNCWKFWQIIGVLI